MATQLKCQTLYPEGVVEIALNAPDTITLTSSMGLPGRSPQGCQLDMSQSCPRIYRLHAWLVQSIQEGGRSLIRITAMEQQAFPLEIRFGRGSASLMLRSGTAVHDLQCAGLDVEVGSVNVLQDVAAKKPPVPKPRPAGDSAQVQKLQQRIDELEKIAAMAMDTLRDQLRARHSDLIALNAETAREIEQLEDDLAQAQRTQKVQEGELAAAREELAKAQAALDAQQRQTAQAKGDTAALEAQIEALQQKALERCKVTQDLTEADTAALEATLREQRAQYLALSEAQALLCADPVLGCQSVGDLLAESQTRMEEAQKRIAAIITLREKINDDVRIAVTGRGKLSVKAEAGEG